MKKLYLTRHAKSDWGHEGLHDIDRPLNQRGYEDAYRMSEVLKKKNHIPELIVTSPAIRAISTSFIFSRAFSFRESDALIIREIYEATTTVLKQTIMNFNDKYASVMLFGHNPGLTRLFNDASDSDIDNLATCAVVLIEFEVASWKNVFDLPGKCVFTEIPKDFKP
jgi:phosphohistidine phosphatase